MPNEVPIDDQVTRAVIITWRTGEEPSIDATGVAEWELYALLDHCMDMLGYVEVGTEEDTE